MADMTKEDLGLGGNLVFEKYMDEFSTHELLTADQEKELSKAVLNKDDEKSRQAAIQELLLKNQRLVINMATKFYNIVHKKTVLDLNDLISAANIGLLKSAQKFDASQGKFSTYAFYGIKHYMEREVQNMKFIKIPHEYYSIYAKGKKLEEEMGEDFDASLIERNNYRADDYEDIKKRVNATVSSLDAEISTMDGSTETKINFIEDKSVLNPEKTLEHNDKVDFILSYLYFLNKREHIAVFLYHLGEREVTLDEIGKALNVTRERIRQMIASGLRRVRKIMESDEHIVELNINCKLEQERDSQKNTYDKIMQMRKANAKSKLKHVMAKEKNILLPKVTYRDLKALSDEIYDKIESVEGSNITEKVKNLNPAILGYRLYHALHKEYRLIGFFDSDIYSVLKSKTIKNVSFSDEDEKFVLDNAEKGSRWLAEKMYTKQAAIIEFGRRYYNKHGVRISFSPPKHKYTEEEDQFIRDNLQNLGVRGTAKKIGVTEDSMSFHLKVLGLKYVNPSLYTKEEDQFIRDNNDKSIDWVAEKLKRSVSGVKHRAKRIGVTFINAKTCHRFSKEDDSLILDKIMVVGPEALSQEIGASAKSIKDHFYLLKKKSGNLPYISASTKTLLKNVGKLYPNLYHIAKHIYEEMDEMTCLKDHYVEKASKLRPKNLGFLGYNVIKNNPDFSHFFIPEIYEVLRSLEYGKVDFIQFDLDFIERNKHEGIHWLADAMYCNISKFRKKVKGRNLDIPESPEIDVAEEPPIDEAENMSEMSYEDMVAKYSHHLDSIKIVEESV